MTGYESASPTRDHGSNLVFSRPMMTDWGVLGSSSSASCRTHAELGATGSDAAVSGATSHSINPARCLGPWPASRRAGVRADAHGPRGNTVRTFAADRAFDCVD